MWGVFMIHTYYCIVEGRVKIVVVPSYLGQNGSDTYSINTMKIRVFRVPIR